MVIPGGKRGRKKVIALAFLFWLSLGLFYYFEPVLEAVMTRQPVRWGVYLIFNVQWVIWGLMTPLLIWLAQRYKIREGKMAAGIARHVLIGLALITFEFFIESLLQDFLMKMFYDQPRTLLNVFYLVLYKTHTYLILYFLIVFVVNALDYMQRYRLAAEQKAEMQEQLAGAQMLALKSQIQPHFLFNTHNTIVSLILKNENEKAIEMITALSSLLRHSLDYSKSDLSPLKEELQIVSTYLHIHQVRFQDRLRIDYHISADADSLLVPSFILQPLVENAILHGIAPYKNAGHLEILAGKTSDKLHIEIRDDGELQEPYRAEGIGMSNTRKRLSTIFGENKFSFGIRPGQEKGTVTYLVIPAINA